MKRFRALIIACSTDHRSLWRSVQWNVAGLSAFGLALAGCATTPTPLLRASTPEIYLHSRHPPRTLARCLVQRLPDSRQKDHDDVFDVFAGGQRWLITIGEDGSGSRLAAHKGAGGDEIEPEVRYSIARCAL